MGSLKPGATYIYEHADGVTYAREFGAAYSERFEMILCERCHDHYSGTYYWDDEYAADYGLPRYPRTGGKTTWI
jgi:hypothetical protein